MKLLPVIISFVVLFHSSFAPPVSPDKENEKDSEVKDDLEEYMEYHRYLREVVQTLENDPEFRERLEKADEEDIRSGKIAEDLDFVNHNLRTKLDEIKRRELERLRHLASKQNEITNQEEAARLKATNEHLDHANPYTFEIEDLRRLIKKTTADLEAADKQRKQEFKEYEMQKEFNKKQKLESMDDAEKKRYMEQAKAEEEAKKHHQPLHHPGSKQQLEEVWEKQDNMDQQFDPKAFFMLHDVDGNGAWDADEVKALFIKELDKIYGPNGPNKDLHERAEEMERMREHVFSENDKNQDGLIDFKEFMAETQKADFNQDEGWKPIEENQVYTQDEYNEFQRRRLDEVHFLQSRGLVDAHGRPMPGAEPHIHQALQQYRSLQAQGQQAYYPAGQVPQGHPQGVPQGHGYQPPSPGHPAPSQGYPPQPQGYPPQGQAYHHQMQQGGPPQQGYQQGYAPPAPAQNDQPSYQNQAIPQGHGYVPPAQQTFNVQSKPPQPQQQVNAQVPKNNQQIPILGGSVPAQPAPSQQPRMENQVQQQNSDHAFINNEIDPSFHAPNQQNANVAPVQSKEQINSQNHVPAHNAPKA